MNDLIKNVKEAVIRAMTYHFPKYPVRFENIEDDSRIIGLGIFAVPETDLLKVQEFVFELEASGILPEGWELLPLVRDPYVTRVYYTDVTAYLSLPMPSDYLSHVVSDMRHHSLSNKGSIRIVDEKMINETYDQTKTWECERETCERARGSQSNDGFLLAA
jgi:hypothetical protein